MIHEAQRVQWDATSSEASDHSSGRIHHRSSGVPHNDPDQHSPELEDCAYSSPTGEGQEYNPPSWCAAELHRRMNTEYRLYPARRVLFTVIVTIRVSKLRRRIQSGHELVQKYEATVPTAEG
jgi:hypothetical protein